ncbi:hypothetical protein BJV82DRAFT_176264 [Fennellomyces sp. T-0311]|nr:hypothetical protein BJV82DRAFT_176264 [Fennellomyces sp. T-0311]
MDVEPTELWRICEEDGRCHCDWRLTAYGCDDEESTFINIYIVNAAVSGIVGLIASWLTYHRVYHLKQDLFDFRTGFPRPKPIESMALMGAIFNFLRLAHAVILTVDGVPNIVFRSFFFEFPWQFGFGALACYLFGIAHTLSDSSKVIYDNWVRSPIIVDSICSAIITMPFITNNICAIAAGVYAQSGDMAKAMAFTDALYGFWTFYTGSLGLIILYAGVRLLKLLKRHLMDRTDGRVNIEKVKLGALKVKIIVLTAFFCLAVFAIVVGLYAAKRVPITLNKAYNTAIAAVWTYDGVIATALIEFSIILNPRLASLASAFGTSSGSGGAVNVSSNRYLSNNGGTSNFDTTLATTVDQKDSKWGGRASITSGWTLTSDVTRSKIQSIDKSSDISSPKAESFYYKYDFASDQIRTRIEEEQMYYNAMTSQVRAPPRTTSPTTIDDHRHRLPDPSFNDGSTTSSATYLTHQPGPPLN